MRVTKNEERGLRIALRLAKAKRQMTVSEIAVRERLPEPTVAKVLNRMARGGVVRALRGRNGGYELAYPPSRLSVGDVMAALDSEVFEGQDCPDAAQRGGGCPHVDDCGLRSVWQLLSRRIRHVFEKTTVADLLADEARVSARIAKLWAGADEAAVGTA